VSHDREFVNNVVTSTLVFEGEGQVNEYVGGYDDWLRHRAGNPLTDTTKDRNKAAASGTQNNTVKAATASKAKKLSYKDQRELDALPAQIESFEEKISALHKLMESDDFYKQEKHQIKKVQDQLAEAETGLSHCFTRWEALEG